jgi:Ca-activated chloride channel family protein
MNELFSRLDPGFLAPIWLGVGLLALVAVALLEIGAERWRRQALRLFAAQHLLPQLAGNVSSAARRLKQFLLLAAVGLLFIALARPHLFFKWTEESRTGLDLFLAIDCSKSMLTEDVNPNRLERAKLAVEDFAARVPNNRLGLVAFAGDAFLECPLTLDHDAFLAAVRDLDINTIPRPGTDIATAIDQAVVALKSQPDNLKFMILITDGEDLEGRVLDAARAAAKTGLKIYTVGVGTASGGAIPLRDEASAISYLHDNDGQLVHSKLDENTLRQIAQITGGAYEPLGQRGEGLEAIYDRYIAPLPKQHFEERREKVRYEQFEWPLGLAALFLAWEFLVRSRRRQTTAPQPASPSAARRRSAAAAVPLFLGTLLLGMNLGRAASAETAERDYKSGQYEDAAQKYGEALETNPNRPDLQYDRGDANYKAGEFNEAEQAYRRALDTSNLNLQENTYYNLGNTQFKHGEAMEKADSKETRKLWEQALHSYESALKLKEAADTRYNYEVVKRKLQELKQQQQQQQQNQKNQSGQGSPSQQNKNQSDSQNQQGKENPQNGGQPSPQQQPGQQNQPGDAGNDANSPQQASSDKNAPAQQRARSGSREQDQQDPGIKNRQEAEALLDSLKDDEHRVSARALNGNTEPPPTLSGKDW